MSRSFVRTVPLVLVVAAVALGGCAGIPTRDAVHRLPASYNFAFYDTYPTAARSFYAAHYAHFGVYETLLDHGTDGEETERAVEALRREVMEYVERPPKFEPPAEIIAPRWSKMAWETGQAMDWSHMLHSQLYDILTDERIGDRQAAGERAIAYYLSEPRSAFSTRGYGHRWMEGGGAWAGSFRERYAAMNGVLWAYHWHHAAIYEALMEEDPAEQKREIDRVIAVFEDSVLADPPDVMPLTAEIAPRFSRMFPAAAHIFDNLHMMHDVANDIMADSRLSRVEKEAEIERLRRSMLYDGQDSMVAPAMPMAEGHGAGHAMSSGSMRVPTPLSDGSWLPQGHPEARSASMDELMAPLSAPSARSGDE